MTADLFWIPGPWRGKLAIAARPRGGDWLDDEAKGWRRAAVNVIVSLLEKDEAAQLDLSDERSAAEKNAIHFISFPISDRGVPASIRKAVSLITHITEELEKGNNVAVHCRQGLGRSGLIAAGTLMASGMNPEQAIQAVTAARGVPVPETAGQREWIRELPSELLVPGH